MLTVTAPRADLKLVSVDALKAELEITGTSQDDFLAEMLDRVSQMVEAHCNQVFALEGVSEVFRLDHCTTELRLARFPVVQIDSIILGTDTVLEEYECEEKSGVLYRLSEDERISWETGKIEVAYSAGYEPMHGQIAEAVLRLAKLGNAARTRDPSLRSENILEGLYSYQLFGREDSKGGLPSDVADLLRPFVNYSL